MHRAWLRWDRVKERVGLWTRALMVAAAARSHAVNSYGSRHVRAVQAEMSPSRLLLGLRGYGGL